MVGCLPNMTKFSFVATPSEWASLLPRLANAPLIALDTESNSFYRYPEHLCLLQVGVDDNIYLVDPIAIKDLSGFAPIALARHSQKIFHDADYDFRCLDREFGFRFQGVFDTAIAIQLLGPTPLSLAAALLKYLNVTVEKSKKLQRANWSLRPLDPPLLQYAANDVAYLPALKSRLEEDLSGLGRIAWAQEEFEMVESIRFTPPLPPEEAVFNMKGAFHLDPTALARLQALFVHRDREARKMRRPPFKVTSNETLLHLAQHPHFAQKTFPGFQFPVLEPVIHPSRIRKTKNPWSPKSSARLNTLKITRQEAAAALGLAPHITWPMESLERMALDPHTVDEEISGKSLFHVRKWQCEILGEKLKKEMSKP